VNAALARRLRETFGDRVRFDEPLAPYTTYRIGGPADALVEPRTADEVVQAVDLARGAEVPWFVLGLGSNILVADAGFRGVVVRVGKGLAGIRTDGSLWQVGAGTPTPVLARQSASAGLAGVHRLVGVPGTVGGGVYMNAGAHGQEFSQVVQWMDLVRGDGTVVRQPGGALPWRYRCSGLGDVVVVGVAVQLTEDDPVRLTGELVEHLRWRKMGTPFNEPCCGSVFRNPARPGGGAGKQADGGAERRTAGQLIDAVGMKGFRIGGAEVSRRHANYIVNCGGATARDVLLVIEAVRQRVAAEAGTELALEVKLIGQS
jgi:UDP-N-acetylmuramate dehydrogenase